MSDHEDAPARADCFTPVQEAIAFCGMAVLTVLLAALIAAAVRWPGLFFSLFF